MALTTILLDLDDTLLESNTRAFVAAYLQKLDLALGRFLATPGDFRRVIRDAIQQMQANQDPAVTNQQAFYAAFLPHFQADEAEIMAEIDRFYEESYPTLHTLTQPRPAAAALVEGLGQVGYKVVIATNPIYPQTAIEQRLAWAGVRDFPYELITYLENMHFSKPAPAYYREILDRIGGHPAETMMVGDDPRNDIAPAQALGLQTWWITDLADPALEIETTHQGSLAEFSAWIRQQPTDRSTF